MVSQMPEQSLSGARLSLPERHPVAMMFGSKHDQNRFRIETDGDMTMCMSGFSRGSNRPLCAWFR